MEIVNNIVATTSPVQPIEYEDFAKLDLRVGLILEAVAVPKSNKLLQLKVDLGESTPRQVIAGIGKSYPPASLIGKKIIVLTNLPTASLAGLESQAMLLAAGTSPGELSLLTLDKDMVAGTKVG